MKPAVVKLFTRPVVKGQRKFVPVNPKKDYPPRHHFYFPLAPKGHQHLPHPHSGSRCGRDVPYLAVGANRLCFVRAAYA